MAATAAAEQRPVTPRSSSLPISSVPEQPPALDFPRASTSGAAPPSAGAAAARGSAPGKELRKSRGGSMLLDEMLLEGPPLAVKAGLDRGRSYSRGGLPAALAAVADEASAAAAAAAAGGSGGGMGGIAAAGGLRESHRKPLLARHRYRSASMTAAEIARLTVGDAGSNPAGERSPSRHNHPPRSSSPHAIQAGNNPPRPFNAPVAKHGFTPPVRCFSADGEGPVDDGGSVYQSRAAGKGSTNDPGVAAARIAQNKAGREQLVWPGQHKEQEDEEQQEEEEQWEDQQKQRDQQQRQQNSRLAHSALSAAAQGEHRPPQNHQRQQKQQAMYGRSNRKEKLMISSEQGERDEDEECEDEEEEVEEGETQDAQRRECSHGSDIYGDDDAMGDVREAAMDDVTSEAWRGEEVQGEERAMMSAAAAAMLDLELSDSAEETATEDEWIGMGEVEKEEGDSHELADEESQECDHKGLEKSGSKSGGSGFKGRETRDARLLTSVGRSGAEEWHGEEPFESPGLGVAERESDGWKAGPFTPQEDRDGRKVNEKGSGKGRADGEEVRVKGKWKAGEEEVREAWDAVGVMLKSRSRLTRLPSASLLAFHLDTGTPLPLASVVIPPDIADFLDTDPTGSLKRAGESFHPGLGSRGEGTEENSVTVAPAPVRACTAPGAATNESSGGLAHSRLARVQAGEAGASETEMVQTRKDASPAGPEEGMGKSLTVKEGAMRKGLLSGTLAELGRGKDDDRGRGKDDDRGRGKDDDRGRGKDDDRGRGKDDDRGREGGDGSGGLGKDEGWGVGKVVSGESGKSGSSRRVGKGGFVKAATVQDRRRGAGREGTGSSSSVSKGGLVRPVKEPARDTAEDRRPKLTLFCLCY
ncbi:unnamed protein product [Closterium sp. NIES-64]|nr:unnamed protein product [Closterium sp. NIES-64]